MKYCPDRQCPYALRYHEGQEYRDDVAACADCGAELIAERPVWPRPSVPNARSGAVFLRLAITLLASPLVLWLAAVPRVPRIDKSVWEVRFGQHEDAAFGLTVFGLGLNPILAAILVVEALALAWPRWRPLRHGGPAGRGRLLRTSFKLGLGLAAIQALAIAINLEKGAFLEPDRRISRLVVILSLVAGTCVLILFAQFLDRFGLAGGFSVLALAFSLRALAPFVEGLWRLLGAAPLEAAGTLAAILAAGASTFILLRRRPITGTKPSPIRLPACGIVPIRYAAAALVPIASVLDHLGAWLRVPPQLALNEVLSLLLLLILTGGLAAAFGFLFNQPSRVAALEVGEPGAAPHAKVSAARKEVIRATAVSAAYVMGLALLGSLLEEKWGGAGLDWVPVVMLVAVGLDVAAEVQARLRHGELVPVWPEHRLYAVDGALALLQQADIPCLARSAHHRALWHFFAPFIPIQILVPPARAEEASRLLHEHFVVAAVATDG
jgi:preprotein translocase subunit SecY